jgi:hypothetical protein
MQRYRNLDYIESQLETLNKEERGTQFTCCTGTGTKFKYYIASQQLETLNKEERG